MINPSQPYFPITHKEKRRVRKKIQAQVFSVNFAKFLRTSPVAASEDEHHKTTAYDIPIEQMLSLNDPLWIILAALQNEHVVRFSVAS